MVLCRNALCVLTVSFTDRDDPEPSLIHFTSLQSIQKGIPKRDPTQSLTFFNAYPLLNPTIHPKVICPPTGPSIAPINRFNSSSSPSMYTYICWHMCVGIVSIIYLHVCVWPLRGTHRKKQTKKKGEKAHVDEEKEEEEEWCSRKSSKDSYKKTFYLPSGKEPRCRSSSRYLL